MKTKKLRNKQHPFEMGGSFSTTQNQPEQAFASDTSVIEDGWELYAAPIAKTPVKLNLTKHTNKVVNNRLKAKRIAEERLIHLSDELSKIADELRYLNPLMAEILDEAHDATEEAIEMMTDDRGW